MTSFYHSTCPDSYISYSLIDMCIYKTQNIVERLHMCTIYIDFVGANYEQLRYYDQTLGQQYMSAFEIFIRETIPRAIESARIQAPGPWLERLIQRLNRQIEDYRAGVCKMPIGGYERNRYQFLQRLMCDGILRIHKEKCDWVRAMDATFLLNSIDHVLEQFFHARSPIRTVIILRSFLRDCDLFLEKLQTRVRSETEATILADFQRIFQSICERIERMTEISK